jgi:hypothetical protein
MKSRNIKWGIIRDYSIEFILILFLIFDVFSFIIDNTISLNNSNRVSFISRGIVEVVFIFWIIRDKSKRKLFLISFLLVLFPIVWMVLGFVNGIIDFDFHYIFQIIKESNKYIFPIILFLGFKSSRTKHIYRLFEYIYVLFAFLVLGAFFFKLDCFLTYGDIRFGYKPPYAPHNEITLFWIIGILYFCSKLFKKKRKVDLFVLVLIIGASMLLGTKAIYLFLVCFSFFIVFFVFQMDLKQRILLSAISLMLISAILYFTKILNLFIEIYKVKGLLYSITSMRNVLFKERVYELVAKWEWYNFFIGGTFRRIPVTEMDFVDLYLMFGIIGSFIYFLILRKTVFAFSKWNRFGVFFVVQFMLIGGMAGHFFSSGINAIYIAIICKYFQNKEVIRIES